MFISQKLGIAWQHMGKMAGKQQSKVAQA